MLLTVIQIYVVILRSLGIKTSREDKAISTRLSHIHVGSTLVALNVNSSATNALLQCGWMCMITWVGLYFLAYLSNLQFCYIKTLELTARLILLNVILDVKLHRLATMYVTFNTTHVKTRRGSMCKVT